MLPLTAPGALRMARRREHEHRERNLQILHAEPAVSQPTGSPEHRSARVISHRPRLIAWLSRSLTAARG